MLDFDKYRNTLPKFSFVDKQELITSRMHEISELRLTKAEYDAEIDKAKLEADKLWRDTIKVYTDHNLELRKQFRADLEKDLYIDDLPDSVRDVFWLYIYERGHPLGYEEIYNVALDVMDLVRVAYRAGKDSY